MAKKLHFITGRALFLSELHILLKWYLTGGNSPGVLLEEN